MDGRTRRMGGPNRRHPTDEAGIDHGDRSDGRQDVAARARLIQAERRLAVERFAVRLAVECLVVERLRPVACAFVRLRCWSTLACSASIKSSTFASGSMSG